MYLWEFAASGCNSLCFLLSLCIAFDLCSISRKTGNSDGHFVLLPQWLTANLTPADSVCFRERERERERAREHERGRVGCLCVQEREQEME